MILVDSVFPAPLSPVIMIDWFFPSISRSWYVSSATMNKCGSGLSLADAVPALSYVANCRYFSAVFVV